MRYSKNRFYIDLLIVLYWIGSTGIVSLFALLSIDAFLDYLGPEIDFSDNAIAMYWLSPSQFLESGLFGFFFGIWFIFVDRLSDKWRLERFSFGRIILVKSGIYFVGFLAIFGIIFTMLNALGLYPEGFGWSSMTPKMILLMSFVVLNIIVLILLLNFILQSIKNMGQYNLARFLTGKYHRPVVEDRTFMFLDLKGSTSHAERMGYLLYSQMIKDCIYDVNVLLGRFQAEVYQYVGDEIVLTWKTDKAVDSLNFIEIFFAFEERLMTRAGYYRKKYDTLPEFKAGCNSGRVTATEIGVVNRDIGFHGDVLNTAARLQGLCNQLGRKLLITGHLKHQIGNIYSIPFEFESFGFHQLEGKKDKVEVFAVLEKKDQEEVPPAKMEVV